MCSNRTSAEQNRLQHSSQQQLHRIKWISGWSEYGGGSGRITYKISKWECRCQYWGADPTAAGYALEVVTYSLSSAPDNVLAATMTMTMLMNLINWQRNWSMMAGAMDFVLATPELSDQNYHVPAGRKKYKKKRNVISTVIMWIFHDFFK